MKASAVNRRLIVDWLLLAGFCGFLYFFGLSYFGLVGADEPRYAQVAREMLARHDWVTPTLGGNPWLEKPVLYYWQAMIAYRIFGVSDWAARLPGAFDATLLALAVYLFLRRFRPGFELDGALIAASAAAMVGFGRAASTDMPMAAPFAIGMMAWYAWRESGSKVCLALFYASIGLAMLAKGPVAPSLAAGIILVFTAAQRDWRRLARTLWPPGIALFCAVALPWYVLVQVRNPGFFREFILEHNLARFSTSLYHHTQPFWYYVPVAALSLMPWVALVIAAVYESARGIWSQGRSRIGSGDGLNVFLLIWLAVPLVFFSISQSKLPGYILPAIPAGTLLVVEYLRRHTSENADPAPRWLFALHSCIAAGVLVPALEIQGLVARQGLHWNRSLALAAALALLVAIAMTVSLLGRAGGLRLLRFITLVPAVLTIGAILKIGGPALDAYLSTRPLALALSSMEANRLPLAAYKVPREVSYGLAFYRDQVIYSYDRREIPTGEHLLVSRQGADQEIAAIANGRRVAHLGSYLPQHIDYYWISAPGIMSGMHH